ncbi:MAG: lipoxygenase family protein [Rhizonema sp. NSF051]|nr:lipoxygenase family protein [Rhizonema sp. NSF051]
MVRPTNLTEEQGQFRYDPSSLEKKGPARLFPHTGEDGAIYYILDKLRQNLLEQGKLSQPWSLLLQQLDNAIHTCDEKWGEISTLLVDLKIFQSGWFNFTLPANEQFDPSYVRERRTILQKLLGAKNAAEAVERRHDLSEVAIRKQQRLEFYHKLENKKQAAALANNHVSLHPVVSRIHEREGGLRDREFARQRLAGQNPMVVRRLMSDDRAMLSAWAGQSYILEDGTSVDLVELATANSLFVANYPILQNLKAVHLQPGRYLGSPVALFHSSQKGLEPLLIELEKGKVVTPSKNGVAVDDWMRAKLSVQTADVTHHELITHLCYTHLSMEAFAIATARRLPYNHPLFQLLHPHFQFLLAINTRGNNLLLGEGSAIEQLLATTREVSIDLMNIAYRERPFSEYSLLNNIKSRGIEQEFIANFPYRDDALLLWESIHNYTKHYLQRYYADDRAVQQDLYLRSWVEELGTPLESHPKTEFAQPPTWFPRELAVQAGLEVENLPDYPRVPDFGEITSLQQLIDTVTTLIFISGPQHAAVNFSQFDYVAYVPNAPLALYSPPDTPATLEELLPPANQDLGQMVLTFALSGIRYGKLGSSDLIQFADRGDQQILAQFQHELTGIEAKINVRNQERLVTTGVEYPYLLPSCIPNSINI